MVRRLHTSTHPARSITLSTYCAQRCFAMFMSILWQGDTRPVGKWHWVLVHIVTSDGHLCRVQWPHIGSVQLALIKHRLVHFGTHLSCSNDADR
jgi:hypothetical protein